MGLSPHNGKGAMPMDAFPDATLVVCVKERLGNAPSCGRRGARELARAICAALDRAGVSVAVQEVHCLGRCEMGPTLRIKGGPVFTGITEARIGEVVAAVMARHGDGASGDSILPS